MVLRSTLAAALMLGTPALAQAAAPAAPTAAPDVAAPADPPVPVDVPAPDKRARLAAIPFANSPGGILDFRIADRRTVFVQGGNNGRWYRADLAYDCAEYGEALGFVASPSGDFDRFSSIRSRGRTCTLAEFSEVAGPPPKPRRKA